MGKKNKKRGGSNNHQHHHKRHCGRNNNRREKYWIEDCHETKTAPDDDDESTTLTVLITRCELTDDHPSSATKLKENHDKVTDTISEITEKPQPITGQQQPMDDAVEKDTKPSVAISQAVLPETEALTTDTTKDVAEEHETSNTASKEKTDDIETLATADKLGYPSKFKGKNYKSNICIRLHTSMKQKPKKVRSNLCFVLFVRLLRVADPWVHTLVILYLILIHLVCQGFQFSTFTRW